MRVRHRRPRRKRAKPRPKYTTDIGHRQGACGPAGAHMLHLFGSVATEMLIRCDGNEGLFCACDNVEFLAVAIILLLILTYVPAISLVFV